MSVRYHCDLCSERVADELIGAQQSFTASVSNTSSLNKVGVNITRSINGVWNGGHICPDCLAAALMDIAGQLRTAR